jgi:hypothetical protein
MPLNPPPRPVSPRTPAQVEIFTASAPTRPFVEIGLIQAGIASDYSDSGMFDLMQALRDEGARHGCEAVVVSGESKMATAQGNAITGATSHERTSGFRAACIMYSDVQ